MLQKLKNKQGFTLIEIVIVLAIAALIMVIVFFAVAGAQRTRKDQQRKDLAARVVSQLENFASNNSGDFPTTGEFVATTGNRNFWGSYMQSTQPDPDGATYPGSVVTGSNPTVDNLNGTACSNVGELSYQVSGRTKNVTICLGVKQWYGPEKQ